jgi:hypothetical protein
MKKSLLTLPIPALLALAASTRAATPVTWDGSTANWTDSAHWSLPAPDYPDADHPPGATYDITINSGTLNLGGGSYLVHDATLTGGNLANGTLTVGNNTTISGPQKTYLNNTALHVLAGGTLTFNGGNLVYNQGWNASCIVNDGTISLLSGGAANLDITNNGSFTASATNSPTIRSITNNGPSPWTPMTSFSLTPSTSTADPFSWPPAQGLVRTPASPM